jgi:PilZ domain
MDNRRHAHRRTAGWSGFCRVEDEAASGWRDCRVLDISTLGVGIKMQYSRPSALLGRRVSVELPAVGDAVNIRFEGEIKNVGEATAPSTVRIGIAFDHLSTTERAILEVLSSVAEDHRAPSMA